MRHGETCKMIPITVSGGFHNAGEIVVRARVREIHNGNGHFLLATLTDSQLAKIWRHLCGMRACICGGRYGDEWTCPAGWERTGADEWAKDL